MPSRSENAASHGDPEFEELDSFAASVPADAKPIQPLVMRPHPMAKNEKGVAKFPGASERQNPAPKGAPGAAGAGHAPATELAASVRKPPAQKVLENALRRHKGPPPQQQTPAENRRTDAGSKGTGAGQVDAQGPKAKWRAPHRSNSANGRSYEAVQPLSLPPRNCSGELLGSGSGGRQKQNDARHHFGVDLRFRSPELPRPCLSSAR